MPSALSHGAFFLLGCPEGTGDTPGLGGAAGSTGGPEAPALTPRAAPGGSGRPPLPSKSIHDALSACAPRTLSRE